MRAEVLVKGNKLVAARRVIAEAKVFHAEGGHAVSLVAEQNNPGVWIGTPRLGEREEQIWIEAGVKEDERRIHSELGRASTFIAIDWYASHNRAAFLEVQRRVNNCRGPEFRGAD